MRTLTAFILSVLIPAASAWGAPAPRPVHGTFRSVTGKVYIQSPGDKLPRKARVEKTTVWERDRIFTGKGSTAQLVLFDGSAIEISPNTTFVVNDLKKPSEDVKLIHFNLVSGEILAKVKKLMTPDSSFEVSAGGVVCGVRGTVLSMAYQPKINQLSVQVLEGQIYAKALGQVNFLTAGQKVVFKNVPSAPTQGTPSNPTSGSDSKDKKGKGSNTGGQGGNNSESSSNGQGSDSNTSGSGPAKTDSGSGNTDTTAGSGEQVTGTGTLLNNPVLVDMNNQFQNTNLINGDTSLATSQQNLSIRLHVGAGEAVP